MEDKTYVVERLVQSYLVPALLPSNNFDSPVGKQIKSLKDQLITNDSIDKLLLITNLDELERVFGDLQGIDETIKSTLVSSIEKVWLNSDTEILSCIPEGIAPDISREFAEDKPKHDLLSWLFQKLSVNPVVYIQIEDDNGKKTAGELVGDQIRIGSKYFTSLNSFGKYALNLSRYDILSGRNYHRMMFKCGIHVLKYNEVLAGIPKPLQIGSKRIRQMYDHMCNLEKGSHQLQTEEVTETK